MRRRLGKGKSQKSHGEVQRRSHIRGRRAVVDAQEVKTSEQTAQDGAADVAAIEEPQPRHALRRRLDPPRDRRQRCAHQERRRHEAHAGCHATQQNSHEPRSRPRRVQPADERHCQQHRDPDDPDPQLEAGIHAQGMMARRDETRQGQAAQTHPAHEGAEQNAE